MAKKEECEKGPLFIIFMLGLGAISGYAVCKMIKGTEKQRILKLLP